MQYFGGASQNTNDEYKFTAILHTKMSTVRDLLSNVFVSPKFWLAKIFYLSRGRGNETSTNIVWYLYSFRALFVLYEAELDNNECY